jgi:transposase-like protein
MSVTCPFCDSNNVEKVIVDDSYTIPYCGETVIHHKTYKCNNCQEQGDFDYTLDKALAKAIDKANVDSAPKLMASLNKDGITMTYFERALRLPFRTTARWKKKKISRESLALLRLIRFCPQLLEVADDNFSHEAREKYYYSFRAVSQSITLEHLSISMSFTLTGSAVPQLDLEKYSRPTISLPMLTQNYMERIA